MISNDFAPLTPQHGKRPRALVVGRASTTGGQAVACGQTARLEDFVADRLAGPTDALTLTGASCGDGGERKWQENLDAALATRNVDVLIVEDLGRLFRRVATLHAVVSSGVRLIALNDAIDTAAPADGEDGASW